MNETTHPHKSEVMSPAGYWPQLQAAIEAGADAVYFGLKHFTARAKVGFALSELPDVMQTLHRRGVRGYVTFNTLIFDHELGEAAQTIAAIAAAGTDAIIVQDVGITQLAHRIAPDLPLYGSTQMSITDVAGIRLAQQFGVSRVVLARELSLDEVRQIRAQTDCELELFVHGALCVSYSGQCFSSEAWGGRSANRGQCAQACRLPYELMVDDQLRPLGDARYLLSPGDLYALHQIPKIVQMGITALKIEGRYKDADYVALTTRAYRQAVDAAWAGLLAPITPAVEEQLTQVYSRGLGPWFLTGTNHQAVVNGRAPRHRGLFMGQVTRVAADSVQIEPAATATPLKAGDGVVFDAADWRSPEEPEEGGHIYQVMPAATGQLTLRFGNNAVNFSRIRPGDRLWRTHDPALDKAARPYTQATTPVHKQPVHVQVSAKVGERLTAVWTLIYQPHIQITIHSPEPLTAAQNQPLTTAKLREQLGRLGNTPYKLADLILTGDGAAFAPTSLLNDLRRQSVEQLAAKQSQPPAMTIHDPTAVLQTALTHHASRLTDYASRLTDYVHLLIRTPEQLEAALTLHPASITLDYLDLYGLRPAVERVQAAGITARVASPRILKPGEEGIVNFLRRLECQILVRANGLLAALQEGEHPPLIGDFSLNAANVLTAHTFLQMGLLRLTPTHDLNAAQITELARQIGADKIEAVVYQHLPVFHTEHCVFCRFLSTGTSYKDCGTPCEKHKVGLRDSNGRVHPVLADVGCRNTVFGAEAQEASHHLAAWRRAGIHHLRLEFAHETADEVIKITTIFQQALTGQIAMPELGRHLHRLAPQNTTEGSLFVPDNYLMLPML
ncbi:MAG: protease [Chloroflexota bacterium]|nr:MAG: protease [Chloroflexota bacterium]